MSEVKQIEQTEQIKEVCLTPREMEMYRLLCAGFSNKEISEQLNVTYACVRMTLKGVYQKISAVFPLNSRLHGSDNTDLTLRGRAIVLGILTGVVSLSPPPIRFVQQSKRGSQVNRAK